MLVCLMGKFGVVIGRCFGDDFRPTELWYYGTMVLGEDSDGLVVDSTVL